MRCLIVEDEFTSRMQLKFFMESNGTCDIAVNAKEALSAITLAINEKKPYSLICLDIKMPGMNGNELLNKIRQEEEQRGLKTSERVKIFMTTGVTDSKSVMQSFYDMCDEYIPKPVDNLYLTSLLKKHSLI